MKVTNKTAYATIGCNVQLSENDRLVLGIELDKITNWLETVIGDKAVTEDPYKAINNLVAFVSKFAIRPSETNVFTDSPEDFKEAEDPCLLADKTKTAVEPASTDDVITVDIANAKPASMGDLATIIYHATTAAFVHIKGLFNSAKESHISCISFVCTCKPVEEVVNELVHSGFVINQNATKCLRLEEFMDTSLSKSSSTRI